jgi:hypothetical protein
MELKVEIDFDESSKEWRRNKNQLGNCMYSYKKTKKNCQHINDNGKRCRKKCVVNDSFCEMHF